MQLETIYSQFHKVLLGFIKSKVRNHQDAEDLAQNVFIKVAAGIENLNRKEKLQSWIYTIARNTIIDYYRANKDKSNLDFEVDVADTFSDEEYIDTTKGLDCCLVGFINNLPVEYREIINEVELNGTKQKELSQKLGIAYPTIRSRVQRGREKLKQILLDCCHVQWDNRGNILEVQSRSACANGESGSCKK